MAKVDVGGRRTERDDRRVRNLDVGADYIGGGAKQTD